jgi:hypothetical protein
LRFFCPSPKNHQKPILPNAAPIAAGNRFLCTPYRNPPKEPLPIPKNPKKSESLPTLAPIKSKSQRIPKNATTGAAGDPQGGAFARSAPWGGFFASFLAETRKEGPRQGTWPVSYRKQIKRQAPRQGTWPVSYRKQINRNPGREPSQFVSEANKQEPSQSASLTAPPKGSQGKSYGFCVFSCPSPTK